MPDITDSVLGFLLNGYFRQWYGHSLIGIFTFDLVGGLLITGFISIFFRQFVKDSMFPQRLQIYSANASSSGDSTASSNGALRLWTHLRLWSFSVFVGILSHVGFDLISHDTNLLLYPWNEYARWFPGWWYITWFEIRPLPMFGQTYAVGIFSVIWCLLTLIGILSFFKFLRPNHENRD